jgi:hypothetical protein
MDVNRFLGHLKIDLVFHWYNQWIRMLDRQEAGFFADCWAGFPELSKTQLRVCRRRHDDQMPLNNGIVNEYWFGRAMPDKLDIQMDAGGSENSLIFALTLFCSWYYLWRR